MFDPLLEDDPFSDRVAAWWRSLKTLEKVSSGVVLLIFASSGLTWPLMMGFGYRVLTWFGLGHGCGFGWDNADELQGHRIFDGSQRHKLEKPVVVGDSTANRVRE
jgi:hypothetical protein